MYGGGTWPSTPARAGPPRGLKLGESRLIARATRRRDASPRGGRRGARSGRAAPASGSRGGPRRSAARRYHGRRSAPTGAPGAGRRLRGSGGRPRGGRTTPGAGARLPRPGLAAFGLVPRRGGTMGGAPGASGRREPVADAASRAFGPEAVARSRKRARGVVGAARVGWRSSAGRRRVVPGCRDGEGRPGRPPRSRGRRGRGRRERLLRAGAGSVRASAGAVGGVQ
jgi:hypothetical protein